jgi:hypothetical protein
VSTSHKAPHDPKLEAHIEKQERHAHRLELVFRRILHWIERGIAAITILVLIAISLRKKRENQPPASLGLPYFREDR